MLLLLLVDRLPADGVPHGVHLADRLPRRPALHLRFEVPADRRLDRWTPDRHRSDDRRRLRRRRALADLPLLRVQVGTVVADRWEGQENGSVIITTYSRTNGATILV